jgi:hypothetical protein
MTRWLIDTSDDEDEALSFLAESTRQDVEGVIEGLFAMITEAYQKGKT